VRLPFPEKIPIVPVFFFAATLCAIQLAQGTNSLFSLGFFFYVLVATLAFNVAGGFTRTSGAFVFFNSVLGVIIGVCLKAYLGEPADSNLSAPNLTIAVLLSGMCMMLLAIYLARKVVPNRAFLGRMVTDAKMQTATVGSLIAGIILTATLFVIPSGSGSVLSALNQLNRFFPMAIVLGSINTIRRSGGKRSFNLPVLIAGILMFVFGLMSFSKEGMFAALACWLLAISSQRYNFSRAQIVGLILATIFIEDPSAKKTAQPAFRPSSRFFPILVTFASNISKPRKTPMRTGFSATTTPPRGSSIAFRWSPSTTL